MPLLEDLLLQYFRTCRAPLSLQLARIGPPSPGRGLSTQVGLVAFRRPGLPPPNPRLFGHGRGWGLGSGDWEAGAGSRGLGTIRGRALELAKNFRLARDMTASYHVHRGLSLGFSVTNIFSLYKIV